MVQSCMKRIEAGEELVGFLSQPVHYIPWPTRRHFLSDERRYWVVVVFSNMILEL